MQGAACWKGPPELSACTTRCRRVGEYVCAMKVNGGRTCYALSCHLGKDGVGAGHLHLFLVGSNAV